MQIKRVEIQNFRKLTGPIIVEGLAKGINVISGGNEEGKSTFLAAVRAAFFQRHTATSQAVKSFQPYNSVVRPEVRLEFELGKRKYKIRKSFCVKPFVAEFHAPEGVFQGAEAEEKIRELFQLAGAKKTNDADAGMWGLLWLDQATAEQGLRTSESGREGLAKLLENDVASIVAGHQGRALLKMVSEDYCQYFTAATGKERNLLKDARELQESAQQKFEDCSQRFELYQQQLNELSNKQDALEKLRRHRNLENAQKALDEATKNLQEIEKLKLELKTCEQREQVARLEFASKTECFQKGKELSAQRSINVAKLQAVQDKLVGLQGTTGETGEQSTKSRSFLRQLESSLNSLEDTIRFEERQQEYARAHHELEALDEQIAAIEKAQAHFKSLSAEHKKVSLDRDCLEQLRKLASDKLKSEARADSVFTRIVLRPTMNNNATIDGKLKEASEEIRLAQGTTIALSGWGEIDITPGGTDMEKILTDYKRISALLDAALKESGVLHLEQAEERYDLSLRLLAQMQQAKNQIVSIAGKEAQTNLANKRKVIEQQMNRLLETFPDNAQPQIGAPVSAPADINAAAPPSLPELRGKRETLSADLKKSRAEMEMLAAQSSKLQLEIATCSAEKVALEESLVKLEADLAKLKVDEEAQHCALIDAEQKFLTAGHELKLKQIELGKLEKTDVQVRYASAKQELVKTEAQVKALADSITHLSASINAQGHAGLGEELERLAGELNLAQQAFARIERHAKAIKLLYETLTDCERQAKEHFLEPVVQKLRPFLTDLFADSRISLDSKAMEITHMERNGLLERYEDLSVGTREQLSVLTRLAVAQLLNEKGQPSVVILDDALVYSDERRMAKLKEILVKLATQLQVIILTCRPSDYLDLSAAKHLALIGKTKVSSERAAGKSAPQQLKLL